MAESEVGIMKKGLTEIIFILDRSNSMSGLEADTIGGFNSMISRQKKEKGKAIVSTILFDDRIEILHDRIPLKEVNAITEEDYFVGGSTALLDAVGRSISHINSIHKVSRKEDVPEKTLFIITTDGMENSSREYSYDKVKNLVEDQKMNKHWEFIFLGANIDAIKVAAEFGVSANRAARYESDSAGTKLNFDVMTSIISCARSCETASMMEEAFDRNELLKPIQNDLRKRHKL